VIDGQRSYSSVMLYMHEKNCKDKVNRNKWFKQLG